MGDISQALEILIRRALNMPTEVPQPKILGESKDASFSEVCKTLGLDEYQAYCQWSRMAPNEFCSAVNQQVEYAGFAVEYDPTQTDAKKFRLHAFALAPTPA